MVDDDCSFGGVDDVDEVDEVDSEIVFVSVMGGDITMGCSSTVMDSFTGATGLLELKNHMINKKNEWIKEIKVQCNV